MAYKAGGYSVDKIFEISGDGDGEVVIKAQNQIDMGNIFGPLSTQITIGK